MTASFYDRLAPFYHLLYGDWEAAVSAQGAALSALLQRHGVSAGQPVLDAACGIGTQALGLLAQGHRVEASDLSEGAVQRLRAEAARRGYEVRARVDDLRSLSGAPDGSMAAVLACDNSVPHLLSDDEILQCFRSCRRVLREGGMLVISVRDYAAIERKNPDVRPHGLQRDADGRRFLAVQAWEWAGDCYDLRMYLTSESAEGRCETQVMVSRYYAVTVARLVELMHEAGFVEVQRHDDVLFQPVLLARRASS